MKRKKQGFTLLELVVVIIIIGILATIGFINYVSILEKGRKVEARTNLGTLRQLQVAWYHDPANTAGGYGTLGDLGSQLPASCVSTYFFSYSCDSGGGCTATRCTTGGKPPASSTAYSITLSTDGAFSGTGTWQ